MGEERRPTSDCVTEEGSEDGSDSRPPGAMHTPGDMERCSEAGPQDIGATVQVESAPLDLEARSEHFEASPTLPRDEQHHAIAFTRKQKRKAAQERRQRTACRPHAFLPASRKPRKMTNS